MSSSSCNSSPQHSPVYYVPQLHPAPNTKSSSSPVNLTFEYSHADLFVHSNPSTPSYDSYLYSSDTPDAHYMTANPLQNPPIRIQQSTPNQGLPDSPFNSPPPMVECSSNSWENFDQSAHLSPHALQQYSINRRFPTHKRISSDSSIGSIGPDSPYTNTLAYPQIVDSDSASVASGQLDSYDTGYPSSGHYPKHQYSTSQQASFLAPAFDGYNPAAADEDSYMAVQSAMRQALLEQQSGMEMSNQGQSASRGSFGDEFNEVARRASGNRSNTAKLDRTISDICQDELYIPDMNNSVPSQRQGQQYIPQENLLSPHKNHVFFEALQAARNEHTNARSVSPRAGAMRERSPFTQTSDFANERFSHSTPSSPAQVNSAAQMRAQQKAEADARVLAEHQPRPVDFAAPNTISPKEVALDYNEAEEDAKMPLFNQDKRENQISTLTSTTPNLSQSDVDDNTSERSYDNMAPRRQRGSNFAAGAASGQSGSNFTFMPPSVPGSVQMPQQYPFISQLRRQNSSSLRSTSDQVPEFPAQLTSMESSKSETTQSENLARPDLTSSAESIRRSPSSPGLSRPADVAATTRPYTCVSPGCTARFDTSARLQKHRREAHRSSPPRPTAVAPTTSSTTPTSATAPSSSSAPANRNQQAGPHKCERINPSTGKPCNTVFSRSYDLTRHEDTIHNNRKQKVRCHLCTEEKTFSRNDALTRHMRVVHPEVDFPGKTRKRGG